MFVAVLGAKKIFTNHKFVVRSGNLIKKRWEIIAKKNQCSSSLIFAKPPRNERCHGEK
jgi:hypothetical protein